MLSSAGLCPHSSFPMLLTVQQPSDPDLHRPVSPPLLCLLSQEGVEEDERGARLTAFEELFSAGWNF